MKWTSFYVFGAFSVLFLSITIHNHTFDNAITAENIEALSGNEGTAKVNITEEQVYKLETDIDNPNFFLPINEQAIQGTSLTGSDHILYDYIIKTIFGGSQNGDFWCSYAPGQVPTMYKCFEIVVSPI